MIKDIHEHLTNIIHNDERLLAFPQQLKEFCLPFICIQHSTRGSNQTIRQEKQELSGLERKKKNCLYSWTTWSSCKKNPIKSTKKILRVVSELSKIVEYKIDIMYFYISGMNNQKLILNNTIDNSIKNTSYLGINLARWRNYKRDEETSERNGYVHYLYCDGVLSAC